MKFTADRAFSDPDKAARKLVELANAAEADRDQRIAIELINLPFLRTGGSVDEYRAGIERAIKNGWLVRHESGTFVKFTQAGADLFARWQAKIDMAPQFMKLATSLSARRWATMSSARKSMTTTALV